MANFFLHIILLISTIAPYGAGAQSRIKWMTWDEAIEKSKKEKRKIFVDIYTDWCGWCKKLDKTTFAQEDIAEYINANYYPVKFDAEMEKPVVLKDKEYKFVKSGRNGYHELAAQLLQGRMSYPSMVFMDEDFNMIQAIPGYQEAEIFEMIITYFGSNSHRSVPWNRFQASFRKADYFMAEDRK